MSDTTAHTETKDGPTDEQKAWAREMMGRLSVDHGDWLLLQGAKADKREAMGDAVEAVLQDALARCQMIGVPAGIQVKLVPAETMAQAHHWMQKELDPDALMRRPVPTLTEEVKVRRPVLRLCRLRVREGDVVVVTICPDAAPELGDACDRVVRGIREAMDRQGLSGLVVRLPRAAGLDDLDEDEMMAAGWTRIERTDQ